MAFLTVYWDTFNIWSVRRVDRFSANMRWHSSICSGMRAGGCLNQSQGGMCIWLVVGVGMGVMQEPFGS